MGVLRIIRYGTEFSFRTKRVFIFILFFFSLTFVTLYAMNEISRENTDLVLSQKTVILQQKSDFSVTLSEANTIASQFPKTSSSVYVMKYIYISSLQMKIFSLDLSQPWANTIAQPNEIKQGSYVTDGANLGNGTSQTYQAVASRNLISLGQYNASPNINMANTFAVNSIQKFVKGAGQFNLKIVGLFDKNSNLGFNATENWVLVSDAGFNALATFFGSQTKVYAYQIIVVANGYSETFASILFGNSLTTADNNVNIAKALPSNNFTLQYSPKDNEVLTQAQSSDLILFIGGIGSPVVATLYAFIISRFRTREMAVLKAVGYSNRNVLVMILTEILTVSIIGYVISLIGLQVLLQMNSQYTLNTTYVPLIWNPFIDLIPSGIAILTFIFIVVSNILGFFIISQKTIKVRPVELFKNVG